MHLSDSASSALLIGNLCCYRSDLVILVADTGGRIHDVQVLQPLVEALSMSAESAMRALTQIQYQNQYRQHNDLPEPDEEPHPLVD